MRPGGVGQGRRQKTAGQGPGRLGGRAPREDGGKGRQQRRGDLLATNRTIDLGKTFPSAGLPQDGDAVGAPGDPARAEGGDCLGEHEVLLLQHPRRHLLGRVVGDTLKDE